MEFLTILLSTLVTLLSPVGVVADRVAEAQIRKQFDHVEQLQVRLDNTPSYQLLQGKGDRLRIAGRGLFPIPDLRIDRLEIETDPLHFHPRKLKLTQPLRTGLQVRLRQADVNRALESPQAIAWLKSGAGQAMGGDLRQTLRRYEYLNPRVQFLPDQRFQLSLILRDTQESADLSIQAEAQVEIWRGRQIHLRDLQVQADGQPVPAAILRNFVRGIQDNSDLQQLERSGITARILQFHSNPEALEIATFVQVLP